MPLLLAVSRIKFAHSVKSKRNFYCAVMKTHRVAEDSFNVSSRGLATEECQIVSRVSTPLRFPPVTLTSIRIEPWKEAWTFLT